MRQNRQVKQIKNNQMFGYKNLKRKRRKHGRKQRTNNVRKLLYTAGMLMTSQIRHDDNEKHPESIVQCTTTVQTVSFSLLSSLSCSISSFRLIFTKGVVQKAT